jgi:hypothetical protein
MGVRYRLRIFSQREWVFEESREGVAVVFLSATSFELAK